MNEKVTFLGFLPHYLRKPTIWLGIIALLSGIMWRVELEYHGWAGLNWLGYFHWSLVATTGMYMVWAHILLPVTPKRRILLQIAAIVYAAYMYIWFVSGQHYWHSKFARFWFPDSPWDRLYSLWLNTGATGIALLPLGQALILRAFGYKIHIRIAFTAAFGMVLSFVFAMQILTAIDHRGGADMIHAIKSGVILPFWTFCCGMVLLGVRYCNGRDPILKK
ncbi:hypothetical protein [Pontibacter sp. G13]|uniref:hypothetical protein n=1 Tax=Pontibacter sp. G13 TaxID=3074898 RepID=UPI002889FFC3|nr:hypothetical protein [Pontibacter sp. G13]WNJ17938.1 hypothetical protein RJD25_24045 [Pontibacter sp. G13]